MAHPTGRPGLNRCTAAPLDGVCFSDNLCRLHGCTSLECNCSEET